MFLFLLSFFLLLLLLRFHFYPMDEGTILRRGQYTDAHTHDKQLSLNSIEQILEKMLT